MQGYVYFKRQNVNEVSIVNLLYMYNLHWKYGIGDDCIVSPNAEVHMLNFSSDTYLHIQILYSKSLN